MPTVLPRDSDGQACRAALVSKAPGRSSEPLRTWLVSLPLKLHKLRAPLVQVPPIRQSKPSRSSMDRGLMPLMPRTCPEHPHHRGSDCRPLMADGWLPCLKSIQGFLPDTQPSHPTPPPPPNKGTKHTVSITGQQLGLSITESPKANQYFPSK